MEDNEINPYQSPMEASTNAGDDEASRDAARPSYKLYSIKSIVLATFLGSIMAGGIVMAINYKRLGKAAKAIHAGIWSVLATILIWTISAFLPDNVNIPNSAFIVSQVIGMYIIATSLQSSLLTKHRIQRGDFASAWGAAGIAILCSVGILAIVGGLIVVESQLSSP